MDNVAQYLWFCEGKIKCISEYVSLKRERYFEQRDGFYQENLIMLFIFAVSNSKCLAKTRSNSNSNLWYGIWFLHFLK